MSTAPKPAPRAALAEQHGVTPTVVRAALRQLEVLGLVQRGRDGTVGIIAANVCASYLVAARMDDLGGGAYLAKTRIATERPRRIALDAELAQLLDAPEAATWLHFAGLRLNADAAFGPLSCVDVWLASRSATLDLPYSLTATAIGEALRVQILEIEEVVTAGTLTSAQARHLRSRGGGPCLHVLRRFRKRGGATVAALRDIHPAERISLTVRLRRDAG